MSNFYNTLLARTDAARQDFMQIAQLQRGLQGTISLATYLAYLIEAYHHVKHTTPLLMACGSRIMASKEWLRDAIAEYIEEELGHQEWILNDIAACGADADAIRHGIPHPATELMVAYAYDTISRGNAVGFFGMVLVLEGTSIKMATTAADAIQQSLHLHDQAFSYLRSHGALDVGHMRFFESLMNRIHDEGDQQAIIHMANMMYRLYGDVFRSIPLN